MTAATGARGCAGLVLLLMGALPGPAAAAGSVYKWVDHNGIVHYDDQSLVRGTRLTREWIDARKVAADPNYSGPVPAAWVALFARDCERAQARRQTLLGAAQLFGITPQGEEYPYTDQQLRLMRIETDAEVRRLCAPDAARRAFDAAQRAAQEAP